MTEPYAVPFNKASLVGNELRYISEAVAAGHISGDGPFTRKCHAFLEKELGVSKVLLTTSCTHALEMCALLLHIQPGDEVILPPFTFVSTINAFALRGAKPVFVDIREDTLNLDERLVEQKITSHTRAILLVHYAGVGCEMDAICDIAARYDIPVVEDNAHGLFARYRGKLLGTFGCLATQSFHETKNFTCGEGGALVINDPKFIDRAEIIREKGTNRSRFFRGQVDKYSWVDLGSSYLPADILAAVLFGQLECKEQIQTRRRQIWETYFTGLERWCEQEGVRLPFVPAHCEQAYHMFYLLLPSLKDRQALISHLRERGILAVFHYVPLHLSAYAQRWLRRAGDYPVAEQVSECLLRLPFFYSLTTTEQARVIDTICSFSSRDQPRFAA
jgi:dTDP-4-amino-4,6-dideoxygalactose transaminase